MTKLEEVRVELETAKRCIETVLANLAGPVEQIDKTRAKSRIDIAVDNLMWAGADIANIEP